MKNSQASQHSEDDFIDVVISHTHDNSPKLINKFSNISEDFNSNKQKRIKDSPVLWTQIIAASACALVHLGIGVVYGYTGVLLPALTNPNSSDIYLNTDQVAIFSSINNLGAIAGSLLGGVAVAVVGQRVCLLFALPLGACSWIILSFSSTFFWLVLARVVTGFAVGFYFSSCHIFVAEIAHKSIRGSLLATCDLFRQCGFLFIYILGSTKIHWRTNALVAGLISTISPFILLLFLPNSPRWLATVNRKEEAKAALTFYRGDHYDVDKELSEIFAQINKGGCTDGSILHRLALFKKRPILKRVISLSVIMLFIHLTGNVVVASYLVSIFKSANTDIDEYMSTILSGTMRIFGALTCTVIADRFRRKVLLTIPLCLAGLSIAILGLYFYCMTLYNVQEFSWVPLASIIAYSFLTGMYYPVVMIIRSELLPNTVRAIASGLHFVILSLGMFLVVFSFSYMVEYIGNYVTFWIYGITCFLIALFVICTIPETKNRTLEQIEDIQ